MYLYIEGSVEEKNNFLLHKIMTTEMSPKNIILFPFSFEVTLYLFQFMYHSCCEPRVQHLPFQKEK